MTIQIDVWSDFVCPWCYLASTSLEKLKESHDVRVTWHSYELRPRGAPPVPADYRARIEAMRPQLEAMAKEQYGIDFNQGEFGIDSRPALVGHKYAEAHGRGDAFHTAVFEAYWLEAKNIEDTNVLAEVAQNVGLDRDEFLASLGDNTLSIRVDADVMQAQSYGLRGVPAIIFADKYYISGAQPYPELVDILENIQAKLS